ncbi:hypothetical protein [Nocardia macrotermitis]|uniref:Excreted virulence factor EspC (Type VII ESX diderm) n=1 Tax=Nocardia macrotermitis TaxID=2585198 RepID=A0A7K0DAV1_9NOCA|nr:hypothetical protein [Nocardia macrotermitis]MQY22906.1 hypothetical protein [Nocardia macrotermitis]
MSNFLQADLDTLHRLGGTLAGHSDAIAKIKVTGSVTMPNSPVQGSADQIADAVSKAYALIGDNIRQMSEGAKTAATTYEETDQAFAAQLHRYTGGAQR